jgi:hypothetical protein
MEIKICSKCKVEKDICEYHKDKNKKDGLNTYCKLCTINHSKEYYENNKEKILLSNKNSRSDYNKEYREKNKEKEKERFKIYYYNNLDKMKERQKLYNESNPEKIKILRQQSKLKNKEKNKEKNIHIITWRSLLNNSLKRFNTNKENKTIELLGYSAQDLKEHLESKFLEGMSWNNRSEWHIDHIIPVSSFNKSEKMSVVNSLDNLQPLWAKDNLSKGSKII